MRNKILNCQNFAFHNVTKVFSSCIIYFYFSAARAYQIAMLIVIWFIFSFNNMRSVKTIAKLNF